MNGRMRTAVVAAVSALGMMACGGAATQVKPPPGDGPAGGDAPYWQLAAESGVIVAEEQGGKVAMRVIETGETIVLADGEAIVMQELFAGEGLGRAEAQVEARGLTGIVPNPRVVVEHRLTRLPEAGLAILTAVGECSPTCKSELWLLARDGWRVKVATDASGPPHVAVHPRGRQVALGSQGLWVVDVPDGKVRKWGAFTAPTYDQHGVLYVRGNGADDSVYEMGEFGNGVLLHTEPGPPPKAKGEPGPDPAPITFAADGTTIIATFIRAGQPVERRLPR